MVSLDLYADDERAGGHWRPCAPWPPMRPLRRRAFAGRDRAYPHLTTSVPLRMAPANSGFGVDLVAPALPGQPQPVGIGVHLAHRQAFSATSLDLRPLPVTWAAQPISDCTRSRGRSPNASDTRRQPLKRTAIRNALALPRMRCGPGGVDYAADGGNVQMRDGC